MFTLPIVKEALRESPLAVIDGGARGKLFRPFNRVPPDMLQVVRFDPDEEAEIIAGSRDIIVRKALWEKTITIDLHLTYNRAVSSVFRPNQRLISQLLPTTQQLGRLIEHTISVPAVAVDDVVITRDCPPPDFIKLDVHGSEYEAAVGASQQLRNQCFGVLAETWSMPFYEGQRMHGHFEALLNDHGFFLCEQLPTGLPIRNAGGSRFHRQQHLKTDSLFFKDIIGRSLAGWSDVHAIKYTVVANLFGHRGYALQLVDYFASAGLLTPNSGDQLRRRIGTRGDQVVRITQKMIGRLAALGCRFS
jgi:FkbM family methyltransferase